MTHARWTVEHPELGAGLVMTTPARFGSGLPVVVRFASGFQAVERESLRLLDGSAWPGLPAALRPEQLSGGQCAASRWLEALRLGTVAQGEGDLFTVGREVELAAIDDDLARVESQGGACRVFCGPYGVGKTHLLEVLARRALDSGLAVARVVLDRQRVAAHRPRRLYREIVLALKLPGAPGAGSAMALVLDGAVGKKSSFLSGDSWDRHPYFTPLLAAWQALAPGSQVRRELLHWICGGERRGNRHLRAAVRKECGLDPGALYALKDHRTVWNQMTGLVSGLSCLIRESGLGRGLAVLLDEAEMCALPAPADQRYGDRALTGLGAAALGPRQVSRPELLRDTGGHRACRDFPPFHRGRNHLYLALAMANRPSGREVLSRLLPKDVFVRLGPLTAADLTRLLQAILAAYRRAFPHFEAGSGLATPLARLLLLRGGESPGPRQSVQQALAFLDGARLWPGPLETYIEECLARV